MNTKLQQKTRKLTKFRLLQICSAFRKIFEFFRFFWGEKLNLKISSITSREKISSLKLNLKFEIFFSMKS